MEPLFEAAAIFALLCSGTETSLPHGSSSPYTVRYTIDLNRGLWCEDRCTVLKRIMNVADDIITLHDGRIPKRRADTRWRIIVNRRTGTHLDEKRILTTVVVTGGVRNGQCLEEPSSGLTQQGA